MSLSPSTELLATYVTNRMCLEIERTPLLNGSRPIVNAALWDYAWMLDLMVYEIINRSPLARPTIDTWSDDEVITECQRLWRE